MKKRHNLTKEKIIEAAYSEWGKNKFCKTSLSDLAERLSITKTALYRHFTSKGDLLDSMEKDLKEQLAAARALFLVQSENQNVDKTVQCFYSTYIPLFLKNPPLLHFLFLLSVKKLQKTGNEPDYFWHENMVLKKQFREACPNNAKELAEFFIRFIYTTGVSQVLNILEKSEKISEKTLRKVIDQCIEIVLTGIHGGKNGSLPDPQPILVNCLIPEPSSVVGEKLFSAIAKVVAKEGIEGATTDKIAREIGITKSSLYFHFKNKQDMLNEMIIDNQRHFMQVFREKAQTYTSVEEKIICYMGMLAAWLLQEPSFLSVFTWVWFQRMELKLKPPENPEVEELFTLFLKGTSDGDIKSLGINERQLAAFIIRLVGQEVQTALREGKNLLPPASELHHIIFLLFGGIHHYTRGSKQ